MGYDERFELWQEHLDKGTESRFKPDMCFVSQEAASSATGLQLAQSLLWSVSELQLMNYFTGIPKLACPHASKEA